jgi:hypothetical protein
MKKHTERQPIDDLFARKLGNMSLPPSSDGFERLQARMGKQKQEAKIVIWKNPVVHRYMAAAACLLIVCLFGWLYWPSGKSTDNGNVAAIGNNEKQVASNKPKPGADNKPVETTKTDTAAPEMSPGASRSILETENEQLATMSNNEVKAIENPLKKQSKKQRNVENNSSLPTTDLPALAQNKPLEDPTKPERASLDPVKPMTASQEQPTVAANKETPHSERVLVVTIAEPEALVAARQAAKTSVEEKSAKTVADNQEKESKPNLWQQVKRLKQGEVLARGDDSENDRGLLGRAYNGLKHSFDKEKSTKQ